MAYEKLAGTGLDYQPCEYPGSKLLFRGPARSLQGEYVAFLGGTDTYGKFIEHPFPALVERAIGLPCVNFGWSNAGVDVFLNDPGVLQAAQNARAVVLQMPCAQNMSNAYYRVHPRRNDRFLGPTERMRGDFPDVDFTQFHFTRHLLVHLHRRSPVKFRQLRRELQRSYVRRLRELLAQMSRDTILLWLSRRRAAEHYDSLDLAHDPSFVSDKMIGALKETGARFVEVCASPAALAAGTDGMIFAKVEESAAAELLGPMAHAEAAGALSEVLAVLTQKERPA